MIDKIEVVQIVACDLNGCIGNNGELPWHLPADLKRFKKLTRGGVVVMGRKTFESLNCKPLPNRVNIVITNDLQFKVDHASSKAIFYSSISTAIEKAKYEAMVLGLKEVWIIGGQTIYEQTMKYTDTIEKTLVYDRFNGDTHYHLPFENISHIKSTSVYTDDKSGLKYQFFTYKVIKEMNDEKSYVNDLTPLVESIDTLKKIPIHTGSVSLDGINTSGHKYDINNPKAVEILETSAATLIRCGKKYDSTGNNSERVMDRIVDMFNAATGHDLSEAQGNIFMVCLKVVRSETSNYHDDDHYIDGVNYFAMAGEAASITSNQE